MLTCKLQGGLGNQLFQIFTTIAYALKYSKPFFFLNNNQLGNGENGSTIRYTYWESFLSSLKPFLKSMNEIPQLKFIKEQKFNYEDIPENFSGTMLVGYFQSPYYFDRYKNMICKLIKLEQKKILVKNKVKIDFDNETIISVHFRLGDYKQLQDFHPILSEKYYSNSISLILDEIAFNRIYKKTQILYFCEEQDVEDVDKTIKNLQILFPSLKFNRASPLLEDWEQMILMSLCNHNIIANSTFSWWGAYLNNNLEKIVCYPEEWFGPKAGHDTSDLFPNDWIKIGFT
jgi:hypothetical protein